MRLMRPYSVLWTASSVVVMALLLRGDDVDGWALAGVLVTMSTIGAAARTLNDVADRRTDALSAEADRQGRPLVTGAVSVPLAMAQVALLGTVGLVVAYAVDPGFGALMTLGAAGLVLYSAGPAPVAGLPLSQVFWLLFWTTVYVSLWLALGGDVVDGVAYVVATCVFMGVGETIAKDLRDLDNDRAGGRLTTSAWLGVRRSAIVCAASYVAGGAVFTLAAALGSPDDLRLAVAVGIVTLLWALRSLDAARVLLEGFDHEEARVLHVGSVRVFLVVNLLFVAGLPA